MKIPHQANAPFIRKAAAALKSGLIAVLLHSGAASISPAANVTMKSSDAAGTTSFIGATNWNNGAAPAAGNLYFTGPFTLRTTNTQTSGGTFPFAGNSLSVDAGGRVLGKIGNNVGNNTVAGTIVGDFILNGGNFEQAGANSDNSVLTVAGNVTVNAASGLGALGGTANGSATFETLEFAASISGSGALQVSGSGINAGADSGVVRLSAANPYSGTISVGNAVNNVIASTMNRILQLNNMDAVSNATVNLNSTQVNPMSFAAAANQGPFNVSGLAGGASQTLVDTAGAAVTLSVGGNNSSSTFAGGLTGGGNLAKVGTGTLTLTGTSGYTGNTIVSGGTLQLGNGGATGSLPGSGRLTNNGVLIINRNNAVVQGTQLSGYPITGTGALIQAGSGTTVLSAANSYSGSTAVNAGELFINSAQTSPGTITVANGAKLGITVSGSSQLTPAALTLGTGGPTTLEFDGISSTSMAPVNASALVVSGPVMVNLIAGAWAAGNSYPLIHWMTGGPADASSFTLGTAPGLTAALSVSGATLYLEVSAVAATITSGEAPTISGSQQSTNDFPLVRSGSAATVLFDGADATVVGITAGLFAGDLQRVTGVLPIVTNSLASVSNRVVLIGTIGHSANLDALIAAGKMDVSAILGGWERYQIQVLTNPFPNVPQALVVAGSDRRGTAYGAFALSETMGVSPWYWYADVPTAQQSALYVSVGTFIAPSPGVKYRGIFLNDEDWGLNPWAEQVFDPSGQVGPTTYARIFELLLRLRANYIWPAMHDVTKAFYTVAGNKDMAENYAIVVGTSHHEPMLRNTSEYNTTTYGAYNYWTNRANIYAFWEQRVIETATNEDIYTVGMRGLGDAALIVPSGTTTQQQADELQNVIIPDQRQMIAAHVNGNPALVPQMFVPYKEALTLYQTGMQVPDDITLCWPDDNHGYIRELSSAAERVRSGGAGVYYHLSYWGPPTSYLWLMTTPPALTCEEMMKAWDYQTKRLWIVNIGDLKPGEIGMEFFLRLASDPEAYRNFDQHAYLAQWAGRNFGATNAQAIATLLDEYYRLNIITRPEQLNFTASGFSLVANGDEAQQRLDQFAALTASAYALYGQLPTNLKAAFYEMILYPIRGADLQNQKVLLAERSRLWAVQGRAATTNLALAAQTAQNAILSETAYYNQTNAGGKWNRTMTVTTTGEAKKPYLMPTLGSYVAPAAAGLGVAVEGSAAVLGTNAGVLPTFNPVANESYFIDVFNSGTGAMAWTAQASEPWLRLSQTNGSADARLWVGIDWTNAPRGYAVPRTITIQGAGATNTVNVKMFYPPTLDLATLPPAVENNGVVTIEAENFTSQQVGTNGVGWRKLTRACASGDGMTIVPVTAASIEPAAISSTTPALTYQFQAFSTGVATVQAGCLPTHKLTSDQVGCRYAISLNGEAAQVVDINADENSAAWSANVLRATAYGTSAHAITNAGLQTLRIWMIDPGLVLDKLTISFLSGAPLEAENLPFTTPGAYHTFAETGASGGGAVSLDATGTGQSITFTVPYLAAGVFDLTVGVKELNNRGIAQISIGDSVNGPFTIIGNGLDFYAAATTYTGFAPIRITNSTAGPKYLKFVVTGRNATSTGYVIVLDSFTFVPVNTVVSYTPSESWRLGYFGVTNSVNDAADSADPDHDGIPNLFEYAMGSYPTVSNRFWFTATVTNEHVNVSFNQGRDATDVTLHVLADNSISGLMSGGTEIWSSATAPYPGGMASSTPVTVIDPQSTAEAPARFIRLKVTRP